MTIKKSVLTITASGLLSILIAVAWVNFGAVELGALIYFFVPLFIGLVTIGLFMAFDNDVLKRRQLLTLVFVGINILTGIFMRLDFYYSFINW